ncbi:MAG: M20/M25/M40 family metallo-hydrolase [Phycisphaerae bacterium]|nr:M20/M25/M40 family metallo-hydrolase [Phycisphaerae bacterium]
MQSASISQLPAVSDSRLRELMSCCLQFDSTSGNESAFTNFLADWAREQGFAVDLWQADERDLSGYPEARARHLPLAGRPTAVIRWPAQRDGAGRSLMFNAHTDVVSAGDTEQWKYPPFAGRDEDGCFFGRGACDVKGPLVAALGAMLSVRDSHPDGMAGEVALELIPGEEDCVGLGTLTSVARGYQPDGLIVLEPTSNIPCSASRGGLRFEITCRGRAVHGTVKWLGRDAIRLQRHVLDVLDAMEERWNDRLADRRFAAYPYARPITVDTIRGGRWQGMICDECTCAGYFELLPGDDPAEWQEKFRSTLFASMNISDHGSVMITVDFREIYLGHSLSAGDPLARTAAETMRKLRGNTSVECLPAGFNAGCEAGLRANLLGTPTLVWGPGSLEFAHAIDERIEWSEVQTAARLFTAVAETWCVAKPD